MADTKKKTSSGRSSSSAKKKNPASSRSANQERTRKTAAEKQEALYKKKLIHDDICAVVIIVLGILLLVWSLKPESSGAVGRPVNGFLFGILGMAAYAVPYFLILFGALIFTRKLALLTLRTWLSIALLFIAIAAVFSVNAASAAESLKGGAIKAFYEAGRDGGGVLGTVFAFWLLKAAGKTALYIICGALVIIALIFIVNTPISSWLDERKLSARARKEARTEEREQLAEIEARKKLEKEEAARAAALAAEKAAAAPVTSGGEKPLSLFDKIREQEESSQKKKENIVALAASETPGKGGETGGQSGEPPKPPVDELPAKTEAPKASQSFEEAAFAAAANLPVHRPSAAQTPVSESQQPKEPKPPVEGLTPESIGRKTAVPGENISDNQQKILDYVKDDNLFAGGVKTEGYGLNAEKKEPDPVPAAKEPKARPAEAKPAAAEEKNAKPVQMQIEEIPPGYVFPPLDLLKQPQGVKNTHSLDDLNAQARLLEETLASFGVSASVVDMIKGPAVTRFEVQPSTGVKVSKITSLQDDLALNLRAKSLRIEAPIPGKAAVGIEISNDAIASVYLREILESKEFKNARSKISVGLGRGISGSSVVANLKDMPHLLIAGATGSGKSVCINSIIISLLYKATPDEVKLILVDPKVVELSCYNGIPHLMVPVVTEPPKAAAALGWAVAEMNDRYNKFAERGVRDLQSYNESVRADGEEDMVMPQIVIIIDELADLMIAAQNQVEDYISRLAAKARAAGMHLIVATQRPSVDVITGVIKANIPSRIAFAVSSQVDSRTILDMAGAEKLLGKGDMLYSPQGISKPVRVQGSFVSDKEVFDVIDYIKQHSEQVSYSESVTSAMDRAGVGSAAQSDEDDDLLADAIDTVVRSETASVSSLQRRFRIGYNRAARLIDLMEERGIVGPADGSRPRKVLLSLEQYEELVANSTDSDEVPEEIGPYSEE